MRPARSWGLVTPDARIAVVRREIRFSAALPMLAKIARLLPAHTHRSEESQALQQFSTPVPLGFVACTAAAVTEGDR
jgi:hypothetical protein